MHFDSTGDHGQNPDFNVEHRYELLKIFRSDLRNQAKRGAQPTRVVIALTGDRQSGEDLFRP
jgi:hypothetical protein